MKLVSALIGLAALGGVALSGGTASAATSTVVVPIGHVCNEWGHCWHRHYGYYGNGTYHPHDYGEWGWRHRGYGYGFYHPHYWGGWRWRHWHNWHNWSSGA